MKWGESKKVSLRLPLLFAQLSVRACKENFDKKNDLKIGAQQLTKFNPIHETTSNLLKLQPRLIVFLKLVTGPLKYLLNTKCFHFPLGFLCRDCPDLLGPMDSGQTGGGICNY